MSKFSKEFWKELANDFMFELNETELENLIGVEDKLFDDFKKITSIDTTGVEPTFYTVDQIHSYLREDEPITTDCQKQILENAPSKHDDYITIARVVK
ncbi:glutamyl-tRNA(Gln) amidotransferase subunit C [Mycoplasma feriruminatoris]|uniref:Aspartyl/glutamyl-tRNA(Asn/Gln) amidotransferase subunit C n=1 Tax=Mycoplasma feriruminatoris TaxID=1179777 RepID=A0AAQ3DPG9_9MOLU|nr:Asp-tRNA(Asn)/Glu-tRNA(Gln) amidotransferase subunit GatC [Mycoplasma feriruminatoris]UKS53864.1 aspartyl/glutamyl-tRNA(Asn/Gln)amidotransferase, C subunit [Mycoplasma feriruminatoris]WFQ89957.1 Aspartyl/glutamyl-tRNA(Asn/Gln) amidotransferase subunit C [Mycoplasma feriruminatoris]WFQ90776.1 glutamyl-tRNA(Gln) amidotransferase subunit C [Mycoplasma feriruminatoris]WFQ91598.1 Aspartyl/glutamyl-tRNA(Asn/Gln) amidotransferase subunit C [Mycoplasma feriruminatoris]WFQ92424.1 Aspartyl/glutamyl-t